MRAEMTTAIMLFAGLALSGCDAPEVKACESFISQQLRSPATYSRVNLRSFDEPEMPSAEFWERVGVSDPADDADPAISENAKIYPRLGMRVVLIEYDAANAYGTPIRGAQQCVFRIAGGRLEPEGVLMAHATRAASDIQLGALDEQLKSFGRNDLQGVVRPKANTGYECCLMR